MSPALVWLVLSALTGARGPQCTMLRPLLEAAADEVAVDRALIAGIIAVESGFKADVTSRSGARGPMQIMPSTGRAMRCDDLSEPRGNIRCGAALLARLLDRYDGRVIYALAAYRMGARDPDRAYRAKDPIGMSYADNVLAARTRYLRRGCAGWDH